MNIKDGGAAFPREFSKHREGTDDNWTEQRWTAQDGMSLRDYFASHAPFTLVDAKQLFGDNNAILGKDDVREGVILMLAIMRYEYADRMLQQRLEQPTK